MPAEQPGGVEETAQCEEVTQPTQARAFLLRGQELVDREGDPADVDETWADENRLIQPLVIDPIFVPFFQRRRTLDAA